MPSSSAGSGCRNYAYEKVACFHVCIDVFLRRSDARKRLLPADQFQSPPWVVQLNGSLLRQRNRDVILTLVDDGQIEAMRVVIRCAGEALATFLKLPGGRVINPLILVAEVRLTRSGRALRLMDSGGSQPSAEVDQSIVRLLAQAHRWWRILRNEQIDIKTLSKREKVTASWMTRVTRLAFLSPAATEAILAGRQKSGLSVTALLESGGVDPSWNEQDKRLLPAMHQSR